MNRIFHYKVSFSDVCAVLLLAALTFYFFWIRSVAVALPVAAVWILVIERILHTQYTFTPGSLIVYSGRFSQRRTVDYALITRYKEMSNCFGLVRYILIEYGSGKTQSVKPQNMASFMAEMNKRMNKRWRVPIYIY